jgi:pimeloyl-ACP methyl ester carboxylesterase
MRVIALSVAAFIALSLHAQEAAAPPDTSPHSVQFVTVAKDVKLEVLDWGGTGPSMVFLAGAGNTAHAFDGFAPKFTATHHVIGITRRGSGASSKPEPTDANYNADRLGDDVLAVMEALKLDRPVLVGHSIAGEELSSVGSRHPEKVSGLVYLDAAYSFAFYDEALGDAGVDAAVLRRELDALQHGGVRDENELMRRIQMDAGQLAKSASAQNDLSKVFPPPPVRDPLGAAVTYGGERYTAIHVPVLAFYAVPRNFHMFFPNNLAAEAALAGPDLAYVTVRIDAFQKGVPQAHIIRLAHADHYIYRSNEAEVFKEMTAFLDSLH